MSKKFYMTPESDVVLLKMKNSILSGSPKDINDGDPVPMGGSDPSEDDGF